jgi:hypothetical protein
MPTKKGKKRLAPQTPMGRPLAKASRPSTPSASTSVDLAFFQEAEKLCQVNPGIIPDIPPLPTLGWKLPDSSYTH